MVLTVVLEVGELILFGVALGIVVGAAIERRYHRCPGVGDLTDVYEAGIADERARREHEIRAMEGMVR